MMDEGGAARPTLLVDGRPLVGNRTGIGVHTAEIASRLAGSWDVVVASHARIRDRQALERARFVVDSSPLGVLWQQTQLAAVAEREGAAVLWAPHGTLPMTLRVPAVVTIHDLTSITMPDRHRLKTVLSFNLLVGRSLAMARRIAAVSRTTADEVVRGFGIPANRIEIVPNGVDRFFSPADGESDRTIAERYVLYAGTIEPRKGVDVLLSAWEDLSSPPRLVLAGGAGWRGEALRRRIEGHPLASRITVTGYVERERLRGLYRHAALFVYPSRYEGFGLPPLEAMACGAPVATCGGGAIPEVVGDAAIVTPPGDAVALRAAMSSILNDASLAETLREKGLARARQFDWDASARIMDGLLAEARR